MNPFAAVYFGSESQPDSSDVAMINDRLLPSISEAIQVATDLNNRALAMRGEQLLVMGARVLESNDRAEIGTFIQQAEEYFADVEDAIRQSNEGQWFVGGLVGLGLVSVALFFRPRG